MQFHFPIMIRIQTEQANDNNETSINHCRCILLAIVDPRVSAIGIRDLSPMINRVMMEVIPPRMSIVPVIHRFVGIEFYVNRVCNGVVKLTISSCHVESVLVIKERRVMFDPKNMTCISNRHEVYMRTARY